MFRNLVTHLRDALDERAQLVLSSVGLLILRVCVGAMMIGGHGWEKLSQFGQMADYFPDPLGLGSRLSLALAVFAEVACSAALVAGFLTRLAAVPLMTTMFVAAFVVHEADPFPDRELALLYLAPYVALLFAGGGRFSLDALLLRWLARE